MWGKKSDISKYRCHYIRNPGINIIISHFKNKLIRLTVFYDITIAFFLKHELYQV